MRASDEVRVMRGVERSVRLKMRRFVRFGCGLVLLLFGGSAAAQEATADLTGQRVRLSVLRLQSPLVGTVVATGDGGLTFRPESSSGQENLRWADVERLQVSRGKKGHALKGLLAGAAAWGLAVGLTAAFDTLDESGLGEPLVIGGFLATGAAVGGLIRTERWSEARVPTGVALREGRGIRLQLAVRF